VEITHFDHLVLTVADLEKTCQFCSQALGINTPHSHGIPIEEKPIECSGATHKLMPIYIRDPEQNFFGLASSVPGESNHEAM